MDKESKSAEQRIIDQNREIIDYLKDSRLFAPFPRKYIEKLVPISNLVEIPKGDIILKEGERNTNVYFLLRGEVSVYSGGEHILNLRRKGDIFGERSIITNYPSLNTVIAETPVRVFYIKSQDIGSITDVSPDEFHNFLYRLFAIIMTDKLSLTNHKAQQYEITQKKLLIEIEEHKQAKAKIKESEEKYRSLIERAPEPVVVIKGENIVYANPMVLKSVGFSESELYKMLFYDLIAQSDIDESKDRYEKRKQGITDPSFEIQIVTKSEDVRWAKATAVEIEWEGNPAFLYFLTDITERKQAEEQLKASLKEKETLLNEIHHRVKNNMAVVASLFNLQANTIEDERIKEILKESQNRVYAMSAVHETLHGSENLSEIDLKTYLSKVTSSIFQTYSVTPDKVKLNTDIEEIPISIDQASPLGLVINELISNSLKYAFPDEKKGEINVSMKKLDKELELIVMDDGIGIPDGFDWKKSNTLGLKLVRTLIENQLDGSIDMESNNGTRFTIKFNIDQT